MKTVLALDVSTSIVGVTILRDTEILLIDYIDFKKCNSIFDKTDVVSTYLDGVLGGEHKIQIVAVEEPLMSFSMGMSSAKTITTLFRFNGMVSLLTHQKFKMEPIYISASHARKVCGIKVQQKKKCGLSHKQQTFNHMMANDLKHIVWPTKKQTKKNVNPPVVEWAYDCVDSYVIAKAGLLEHI